MANLSGGESKLKSGVERGGMRIEAMSESYLATYIRDKIFAICC